MKQISIDNNSPQAIEDGFKQLIEAKSKGEFAVFVHDDIVNTTDDIPQNYFEMDYASIADYINQCGLKRQKNLKVQPTKETEVSSMTIYKSVAKDALVKWEGLTEEDALKTVKEQNNAELENRVHASNSVNYAIDGLAKVLNLSFMEKQQFAKAVFEGPENAEIIKEVTNKAKGLTNEQILAVLTVIHDGWVKDNANEQTFEKKKNQQKLRQYAPFELIGWNEVKSDMLFLKPILDSLNVPVDSTSLSNAYKNRVADFAMEKAIWSLTDPNSIKTNFFYNIKKIYPNIPDELAPKLVENCDEMSKEVSNNLVKTRDAYYLSEKRINMCVDNMKEYERGNEKEKISFLLSLINAYKAYYNDQLMQFIEMEKEIPLKIGIGFRNMHNQGIVSKFITRHPKGPYSKLKEIVGDKFADNIIESVEKVIQESYHPTQTPKVNTTNRQVKEEIKDTNVKDNISENIKEEAEKFVRNVNNLMEEVRSLAKRGYSREYSSEDLEMALLRAKGKIEEYYNVIPNYEDMCQDISKAILAVRKYQHLEREAKEIDYYSL